jgi:transposase
LCNPEFKPGTAKKKLLEIPIEDRLWVTEVCTDMDNFYINAAKECFPNAKIVIDHYHMIAWGLKFMNSLRTTLQVVYGKKFDVKKIMMKPAYQLTEEEYQKLQPCFEAFPEVKVAWKIIHQLRKIYWQKDWKKAESQLRKVIWLCEQSYIDEMKDLAKTLKRRKEHILNYYISKTTNAVTEALHSRFETMKRQHCGIRNVERFAKRLMFSLLPFAILADIFTQTVY